ncbi:hypothetical protein [Lactiplantibacillus plantarum]|nr:hypothetical protein [Lactiplantibacillus plantarum]
MPCLTLCLSTGLAILGLMATSLTAIGATTNGTVTFKMILVPRPSRSH